MMRELPLSGCSIIVLALRMTFLMIHSTIHRYNCPSGTSGQYIFVRKRSSRLLHVNHVEVLVNDCPCTWSEWTSCSQTCDEGITTRSRSMSCDTTNLSNKHIFEQKTCKLKTCKLCTYLFLKHFSPFFCLSTVRGTLQVALPNIKKCLTPQ